MAKYRQIFGRDMSACKDDASSYGPSSNFAIMAYVPSCVGVQSCSFADAFVLSVLSMFVCIVVTFFSWVGSFDDESLCDTPDATQSSGRCIGAMVTIRMPLVSFALVFRRR